MEITHIPGTVMKSLGQNPTDRDLADMIKEADGNENGVLTFQYFNITSIYISVFAVCISPYHFKTLY